MGELFSFGLLTASPIAERVFKSIDILSGGCSAHLLMNVRSEMCMGLYELRNIFEKLKLCMSCSVSSVLAV